MSHRNRAFEDENDESNGRSSVEIHSISKKIYPHTVDGVNLSKIADKFNGLNINDFATRKTIAQGMLDLALLTANAAQLKRVLTIGPNNHRFYHILLVLITLSICLQVIQGVIMCILAIVFDLNKVEEHRRTNIANNILLATTICSVSINIIISTFDIADIK
ncbi:hypothetical protein PVAND_008372 [Polypedilum vanderplanki]|uniref:Ninjurin-1 n=1 Tax=Polypedilum vanderplanki TaxID=319348 RepID=A0A9J6C9A0_POLVA|nr:hypothetical protein PVAND_008372 [Polypedilum vanderplanki]